MAANVVTKTRSYTGDQAGAFVDIVTFTASGDTLMIENRSSTVNISFTYASGDSVAATPTSGGDNCFYVPAGAFRSYALPNVKSVKLIGSTTAMSYWVGVV